MCRDEIGLVGAEGVVAAGDDHELRAADRAFEMLADGRRADPVVGTPEQKGWDVDRVQPCLKVRFCLQDPPRRVRKGLKVLGAPVLGAERGDVDAP